ncbi:hypothetical protein QF000_001455 [Paraburkholderia atlantica]|uniref:Uncharacterized protein n=2 Tax=Paraburkholderia atlantica TaxID=2654982 RepID=A0A7W8QAS9_PARAM|nr:hypothetical protein [Paraburkholderia atlantica]MBB5426916.1 hypothetical protein [Paraburkholderia atlantica]
MPLLLAGQATGGGILKVYQSGSTSNTVGVGIGAIEL